MAGVQGSTPETLFEEAIEWLRDNFDEFAFQVERDVVWTVQTFLTKTIRNKELPLKVFNDFPMIPGSRRSRSADLVLVGDHDKVEVAAEFKYEPSHRREDIQKTKLPVVFWGTSPSEAGSGVAHDIERIRQFIELGKARTAYAIFIDEGGHFRHRDPVPGSRWLDWEAKTPDGHKVSILWTRWPEAPVHD